MIESNINLHKKFAVLIKYIFNLVLLSAIHDVHKQYDFYYKYYIVFN